MTYVRNINRFMLNHIDLVLDRHPSTEQLLGNEAHNIQKVDLSGCTEVRVTCFVVTSSASPNTPKLSLQYYTSYTTAPGTYLDAGVDPIEISLASTGLIDSGWVELADAAKDDVYLVLIQSGGDGVAAPVICRTFIETK